MRCSQQPHEAHGQQRVQAREATHSTISHAAIALTRISTSEIGTPRPPVSITIHGQNPKRIVRHSPMRTLSQAAQTSQLHDLARP